MANVVTWPMPQTELASKQYKLEADGMDIPVWLARVRETISQTEGQGWTNMLGGPTEWASFARLDADYPVEIVVSLSSTFENAQVLPHSASIALQIEENQIRFHLDGPRHLTLCIDGNDQHPLHLFCREKEKHVPQQGEDNVIYFGPGEHWVHSIELQSGQTLYLDGGAVLRPMLRPGAQGTPRGVLNLKHYGEPPVITVANASDVRICGRGIIDGSLLPHPAKTLLAIYQSQNVHIEGITLRHSPSWHLPIHNSADVTVDNIACISGRLNSDGVNCVNSKNITVRNVFVRSHDDSFVVKTKYPDRPSTNILYENCVSWNDWGCAFGVTYETRAPISNITFRDCDVIFARNWPLCIHLSDSATVGPVTFERIGIHYLQNSLPPIMERACIRLNICPDEWGADEVPGRIRDIIFKDLKVTGVNIPPIIIRGYDENHRVENIEFNGVRINDSVLQSGKEHECQINVHTERVTFSP